MNTHALDTCMRLNLAHARLRRKLDDELGTLHGLSLDDFVLLQSLADAPGGLPAAALERPLGVQRSAVVRQVIALEKTGLVQRDADAAGQRRVQLRGPGRRLLQEAAETAAAICARALAAPAGGSGGDCIRALCDSPALDLR